MESDMIGKAPRKKATKKPSSMKRTGKAMAKPGSKAKKKSSGGDGSKYLGTGAAAKAAEAIKKAKAKRKKAYDAIMKDL